MRQKRETKLSVEKREALAKGIKKNSVCGNLGLFVLMYKQALRNRPWLNPAYHRDACQWVSHDVNAPHYADAAFPSSCDAFIVIVSM
jgi:hypothetical protein